ncbi:MAG: CoA transferase [Chloroflexi bacterium]|nr:CoA transferase [Chloroflexota bacterium]
MAGALEPYRILEFGGQVAGAVLGMLLADQGAEVVKIEPPDGDPLRGHPVFSVWNRGKKSVVLDLAQERDASVLSAMIRSSDVLIESFLSSDDRVWPDYQAARDLNRSLVYVSLPGFGADHPENGLAAWDTIIGASTGIYTDRSSDGASGPSFISLPYASIFGAMVAAPAITAALFHRVRTGEGQRVTVPLYDAMFTAMGASLVSRPDVPSGPGALSPVIGRFYQCRDDRWVNINAGYERSLRPMLQALGHPEWHGPITAPGLRDNTEERRVWEENFSAIWKDRTALEWERIMALAGVPCTMCRTIEEWMETAQARESGAVVQLNDPTFGPMRQVGIQVRLSETPGEIRGPAPSLGQHTESVIADLA